MSEGSWFDTPTHSTRSLSVMLFGTATVLASMSLFLASVTDRDPIRITVSGIFLISFFGQTVAVVSGSAQEARTMLVGSLAAFVLTVLLLAILPLDSPAHQTGVANVARGLLVACVLTALGYFGHRIAKGLWL